MKQTFRSFAIRNFRLWVGGLFVSATGSWMQITAQDWVVLTELTDHDAAVMGVIVALQFAPQLVLTPFAGALTDRFDRKRILLISQWIQLALAVVLGVLVLTGTAQLWHVMVLALVLGCVSAFDGPARQTFIVEVVSDDNLSNGVSLSSAAFNAARLVGPAVAGVAIAAVGSGWVFIINAASFVVVIAALLAIRRADMQPQPPVARAESRVVDGLRYLRHHGTIIVVTLTVFLIGATGLNAAIFIATMATVEFGAAADGFGILTSALGLGSVIGSLFSASLRSATPRTVLLASAGFVLACIGTALAPSFWTFGLLLPVLGFAMLVVMTTSNSYVQLATEPRFRGRVMGIYMAAFMAGAPLGGPAFGLIVNEFGPRWAIAVAALLGAIAVALLAGWLWHVRRTAVADPEEVSLEAGVAAP